MGKIFFALLIFSATAILSCRSSNIEVARQELLEFAREQKNEDFFNFEVVENDSAIVSFFRNKSIDRFLLLTTGDTSVLIELYSVKFKNGKYSTIYQSQIVKKDSLIFLEVIDLKKRSTKVVKFPQIKPVFVAPGLLYPSYEACLSDFYESQEYFDILSQVNRTCKPSPLVGPCCHLTDGTFICIDLIINPTHPHCLLVDDFAILQSRIPPIIFANVMN